MKVLLVAPRTNLEYADSEVQEILRSGLNVTPLLGTVNYRGLVRELSAPFYDVLWLCTHGGEEGILLSDGIVAPSLLAPLIRGRFRLVVLNSCVSIDTAQMLQNETESDVVATVVDVPDREAFQTGALFARQLAEHGDVGRAYRLAKPGGNRTYVWLAGVQMRSNNDREHDGAVSVEDRLDRLEAASTKQQETLRRIVTLMDGDPSWRIVGFPDQLSAYIKANEDWKKATEARIKEAEQRTVENGKRISDLEYGNKIVMSPQIAWFIGAAMIVAMITVYFLVGWVQSGGG